MKAILIDAKNKVTKMVTNTGDLNAIYLELNVNTIEIGWFDTKSGDTLWIDEEGRINGTDYGFKLFDRVFYGNGIIYGSDLAGDNVSVKMSIDNVNPEFIELEPNPQIEIEIEMY